MLSLRRHPSRLTWGRDGNPVYRSEFLGGAHFDDDVPAALQAQVTRRAGGRHIERYPMVLSGDGQLVRADLVGCVTVSNHPVCTHHDSWGRKQQKGSLKKKCEVLVKRRRRDGTQTHTCDVHLPHGEGCHAVCYKRGRDSLRYSLVRRQSGPLVVRPRLCAVHALQPAQRVEASHHAYTQTHISYSTINISTTTFFSHSEPALQSHPAPSRIQLWPASRCCSVWGWSPSPWGRQKGCAELHSYRSSCCHWRHAPACLRSRQLHCRRGGHKRWELRRGYMSATVDSMCPSDLQEQYGFVFLFVMTLLSPLFSYTIFFFMLLFFCHSCATSPSFSLTFLHYSICTVSIPTLQTFIIK